MRAAFKGGFGRFLAGFFAVAITLALGVMGNMVQSNSITDAFHNIIPKSVNIPQVCGVSADKLCMGVLIAAIAGFIFIGGISRIASFTEKVVPIMAALYLLGGLILLIMNFRNLPAAIASIFVGAFNPQAVCGAGAGIAVRQALRLGVARGLFSNEAGMGSTPHAHAMAKVEKPQDQGEVAMVGVFIDTFVVLTMTALVILSSNVLGNVDIFRHHASVSWNPSGIGTGTPVAQAAFSAGFGKFGPVFVAICLLFFAFSTIIGWYFFAQQNIKYLVGTKFSKPFAFIVIIFIFIGSLLKVDLVWNLSDLFNGIMVLPNLVALLALSGAVAKLSHGQDVEL
jgi:AGCS family alanine or glycine:cation symporter